MWLHKEYHHEPTLLSNVRFQQVQTVTYMCIYLPRSIFTYIVYHIIYDMHQSAISLNSSRINPKTQLCANANGILQETYSQCTIKPKVRDKLEQNICTAVLCFWEKRLWHEGWMYLKNSINDHGPSLCIEVVLGWRVIVHYGHSLELEMWSTWLIDHRTEIQVEQSDIDTSHYGPSHPAQINN